MSCLNLRLTTLITSLTTNPTIKLILHEGTTKTITKRTKIKAGEIMFEYPDSVICHADSFFLGKPIPILSIDDYLKSNHTYFILPLDRLPASSPDGSHSLLSAASLCSLGSPSRACSSPCPSPRPNTPPHTMLKLLNGHNYNNVVNKNSPLEYVKDKEGRVLLIKIVPGFITEIIKSNSGVKTGNSPDNRNMMKGKVICDSPQLERRYELVVRGKDQTWSPSLKTITEHKLKFSPLRLFCLERKQKN